jgi:hypothetical protein
LVTQAVKNVFAQNAGPALLRFSSVKHAQAFGGCNGGSSGSLITLDPSLPLSQEKCCDPRDMTLFSALVHDDLVGVNFFEFRLHVATVLGTPFGIAGLTGLEPESGGALGHSQPNIPVLWAPQYPIGLNRLDRRLLQAANVNRGNRRQGVVART